MDSMNIGCSPHGEPCAQVGAPNYKEQALKECRALINQLRRIHGPEPAGARLAIKANPHEAGTYHEVEVRFDENNEKAVDYAYSCEAGTPEFWDSAAKKELGL